MLTLFVMSVPTAFTFAMSVATIPIVSVPLRFVAYCIYVCYICSNRSNSICASKICSYCVYVGNITTNIIYIGNIRGNCRQVVIHNRDGVTHPVTMCSTVVSQANGALAATTIVTVAPEVPAAPDVVTPVV